MTHRTDVSLPLCHQLTVLFNLIGCCLASRKRRLSLALLLFLSLPADVSGEFVTDDEASAVVRGWMMLGTEPLHTVHSARIDSVDTYVNDYDEVIYYVVYVEPDGFVIVPADDTIEPIIAFAPSGEYDPADDNPLGALVSRDLMGRMELAWDAQEKGLAAPQADYVACQIHSEKKWRILLDAAASGRLKGIGSVSDERVGILMDTRWSQSTAGGQYCYNYYTPNHYVCGCVATAASQIMKYNSFPTASINVQTFNIEVNSSATTRDILGGTYDWGTMVNTPNGTESLAARQAIGKICHDAGVASEMNYTSSGSGASALVAGAALKSVFGYANCISSWDNNSQIPTDNRNLMIYPNLDAELPVLLSIYDGSGGHAVVADGYGYNSGTLYTHINMGWAGTSDAWYNLPTIGSYTTVYGCNYNIFKSGTGEIISGRVLDSNSSPLSGATVSLSGSATASTTSNSKGIYAFKGVPSGGTFTVSATKAGYSFQSQSVTTGTSVDVVWPARSFVCGNKWGVDLTGGAGGAGATITSPAEGTTFGSACPTFEWTTGTNVTEYRLQVGTAGNASAYFDGRVGYYGTMRQTVCGLPLDGSVVKVVIWSKIDSVWQAAAVKTYTAYTVQGGTPAEITSPTGGSTITSASPVFYWNSGTNAQKYYLEVGTDSNHTAYFGHTVGQYGNNVQVIGLPIDGSAIRAQLYTMIDWSWQAGAVMSYTAYTPGGGTGATITSPTSNSTLTTPNPVWEWTAGTNVQRYWLKVGNATDMTKYFNHEVGKFVNYEHVIGIPTDGSAVRAQLSSMIDWAWVDGPIVNYTAYTPGGGGAATITSPAANSTLTTPDPVWQWTAGTNVQRYWLRVGDASNLTAYFNNEVGKFVNYEQTTGLPLDGSAIRVQLSSMIDWAWVDGPILNYTAYTPGGGTGATITSPAANSTLTTPNPVFTWTAGTNVQRYWLRVGNATDLTAYYNNEVGDYVNYEHIVQLPIDGSAIRAQLSSKIDWAWVDGPIVNYTAYTPAGGTVAAITSPANGSTLTSSQVIIEWDAGTNVQDYLLQVGTAADITAYYNHRVGHYENKWCVLGLPTDGSQIKVQLWSKIDWQWQAGPVMTLTASN